MSKLICHNFRRKKKFNLRWNRTKIYLSETKEKFSNSPKFKKDKTNQTASLFKIIIPRAVEHESVEYLINIKTLKKSERFLFHQKSQKCVNLHFFHADI